MINFTGNIFVAIGLVNVEIFPKMLFFPQGGQLKSFFFKKFKKVILMYEFI